MKIEIFKPLDWNEFKLLYKSDIRTTILYDRLAEVKTGMVIADKKTKLYHPHYEGGDWRDGKPTFSKIGDGEAIVRVPSVKLKDGYFLLDGNHRIKELKPMFVVLDYLELTKKQSRYFDDLINESFANLI